MSTLLRNVLAVIVGIAIGGVVNTALITLSPSLIPPPAGVDVNSAESPPKPCTFSSHATSSCRSWRMRWVRWRVRLLPT